MDVQVKDGKAVISHNFTEEEYFTARCIGAACFPSEGVVIVDLKTTRSRALLEFFKAFPNFSNNMMTKQKRDHVYALLKAEYEKIRKNFYDVFEQRFPKYTETGGSFMKHQRADIIPLVYNKHNLLGWEQGLGKTIEAAAASKVLNIPLTLIICPAFVKWGTYRELTREWGFDGTKFSILDSSKSKSLTAFLQERFVIVNYEMVESFWKELSRRKFGHIIIDECHKIKNVKSARFKAIRKIVANNPDAKITLASGTPISNRPDDLFAYLRLCDHPLGNNEKYFKERYLDNSGPRGKVIGARNSDELAIRISNFLLRRTADECLDLPEKNIARYYFTLDEYQAEYDKVLEEIEEKQQERFQFLEANKEVINQYEALKLRALELNGDKKAVQSVKLYYQQNIEVLERYNQSENLSGGSSLHSLNRITAMAKIAGVMELVEQITEQGRKVAIFGTYYAPLEAITNQLGGSAVLITGRVPSHKRQTLLNSFVEDPECKVYVANMEAGGVGINGVQKVCSDVIFLNMPFVPKDLEQALARVVRQGQRNVVNVYFPICENSIDESLYTLISDKATDNHHIIDRGNARVMDYSNIEMKLFNTLIKKENA